MKSIVCTLNNHFGTLSKLIEKNKITEDKKLMLYYDLEALSFYIRKHNLDLSVVCNITSKECNVCGEPIKKISLFRAIKFQCNHLCCSKECLQNFVKYSNEYLTDYQETKCLICNKYILPQIIEEAFGGKDNFALICEEYEDKRAARFVCKMCYTELRVDQGITLNCDHRYCPTCIKTFAEAMIDQCSVSEDQLACPECGISIGPIILKMLLTHDYYEKYSKFILRLYVPSNEEGPIVFYKCNGKDCEYFVICDIKQELIKCPNCSKKRCPKCRRRPHIGINCEESQKKRENKRKKRKEKQELNEFLEVAKQLGYKKCPHCNNMCERISGCNFMRCKSKECKGINNFCLLCEKPLLESQHYSHYKAEGPYGKKCNTLDGTP